MRLLRIASIAVLAFAPLTLAGAQRSVASSPLVVTITDECGPDFNIFLQDPNICNRAEGKPFLEFIAEVRSDHAVGGWEFDPDSTGIDAPASVRARNIGGETHTFTKVKQFGNGFVPELNNPTGATNTVAECKFPGVAATFVGPGGTTGAMSLPAGSNRFQCCIHPWMRTTINVER